MKVFLFCLFAVLLSCTVDARFCVQCLGDGAYCGPPHKEIGFDSCVVGTKCVKLENGLARVCLPTFNDANECKTSPYDNCPSLYYCNEETKKCQLNPGIGRVNDGCEYDDDCFSPLVCSNSLCASPDNITCITSDCPFGQKCEGDVNPTCVDKGSSNADCTSNNDCWKSSCIGDLCRNWFTGVAGGKCTQHEDCSVGLACELREDDTQKKCYEPMYHYISPTGGSFWGRECDSSVDSGCKCNYGSIFGIEQLLIEELVNKKEPCKLAKSNYYDCMKDNKCYSTMTYEHSCMRQHCWSESREHQIQCSFEGANPVRCSASDLLLGVILIIAMLFLH